MNRAEFDLVKNFTYTEYCDYLKIKYGKVPFKYGSNKNKKAGYFIHHIAEDTVPSLSHPEQRKQFPEYQVPELLVYCDYLEHLLLHIMIGREKDPALHLGLNGPCRFIIPNLINFYEYGVKQKINNLYYSLIERDKEVFDFLIAEYNELVKDIDLVLEHNVSLYAQVEESLNTKGKAHATLGTGLGKTTLALQYVKTHSCRALVVCPNNIVKDSWIGNGSWTVPVTYQTLASKYDPDTDTLNFDLSSYNLVILDEVHHVGYDEESGKGAQLWGKAIKKLFDSGIKILGLTATEIRSDGIDVSEQFFAGCNFEGYSFEKAIEEGIVHPISYVTTVYDWSEIDQELEDLGIKVDHDPGYQKLRGQLDVVRNDTPELTTILRNSLRVPQSEMRGIAFIQDEKDEERVLSILQDAYPGVLLLSINSHMDKKEVDKNKKLFANPETKNAILVAINMVTEGAHYRGINTGIMFRTTESWVLYAQMVGRFSVLTTYPNPNGVIIDLVNNLNRIKYNDRVKDTKKKPVAPRLKDIIRKLAEKSDQVIYEDYTQNFVARMKELKEYCDDSWEDWEIEILETYYESKGPTNCSKIIDEAWLVRYPESLQADQHRRSPDAIHTYATRKLRLFNQFKAVYQLDAKFNIIKRYNKLSEVESDGFSRGGVLYCCQRKTTQSGGYHWCYASDYSVDWHPAEVNFTRNAAVYCRQTELVYDSLSDAAKALGVNKGKIGRCCNNKEAHTGGYQFCWLKDLDIKVWEDIIYTAEREYSSDEVEFLKKHLPIEGRKWCAEQLGRSVGSIAAFTGRHLSVKSARNRKVARNVKQVYCIELKQHFENAYQAEQTLRAQGISLTSSSILRNCKGETKSAGGYHWKYVD